MRGQPRDGLSPGGREREGRGFIFILFLFLLYFILLYFFSLGKGGGI